MLAGRRKQSVVLVAPSFAGRVMATSFSGEQGGINGFISFSADGPAEEGGPNGRCYELEAMSPAMLLAPGQSFTFRTRTMYIRGPRTVMAAICRRHLGPEIATLEAFARLS